jgi:hypothetical protein
MSGLHPIATELRTSREVRFVPTTEVRRTIGLLDYLVGEGGIIPVCSPHVGATILYAAGLSGEGSMRARQAAVAGAASCAPA